MVSTCQWLITVFFLHEREILLSVCFEISREEMVIEDASHCILLYKSGYSHYLIN